MPINYAQIEAELSAAGTPFNFVNVPDYGVVKFYELAKKGPELSYQGRVMKCERTFRVWPYERAWGFCAWQIGWSRLSTQSTSSGSGVLRHLPQPLPIFNRPNGKALGYPTDIVRFQSVAPDGIRLSPIDGATICGQFAYADITVSYGSVPYRQRTDALMTLDPTTGDPDESGLQRFVSKTYAPSAKHVQFPAGNLRWQAESGDVGGDAVNTQTMGRLLPFCDVAYTWHEVPAVPHAVFTTIGKVNEFTFDGIAAERYLLVGIEIQPRRMVTGDRAFDFTYRMKYSDLDGTKNHNYFFRVYKPSGAIATDIRWKIRKPYYKDEADAVKYVFETADFRNLFRGPFEQNWIGE